MKVNVLLASGDEEEWEDVQVRRDMDGSMILEDKDGQTQALYAPGMWMRVHFEP